MAEKHRYEKQPPRYLLIGLVALVLLLLLLRGILGALGSEGAFPGQITVVDTEGLTEAFITEIRTLDNLILAEYRGVVFLRETLPVRLLGVRIYDVDVWKQIPGVARASINLSSRDLSQHVSLTDSGFVVLLPAPSIGSCELLLDQAQEGISQSGLPGESAESIAQVEEAMYTQARLDIITMGISAGLFEDAEVTAKHLVEAFVAEAFGEGTRVWVEFSPAEGGSRHG